MYLERLPIKILPDCKRVIAHFFHLNTERTQRVIDRIFFLSDDETTMQLERLKSLYESRHKNFENVILSHYKKVEPFISDPQNISVNRKLLIGAYFSKEYSIEAAALFNPSIALHPDQSGLSKDEIKFIVSLRATGEGHLSSIEFREGIIGKDEVTLLSVSKYCQLPVRLEQKIFKKKFIEKRIGEKSNLFKEVTKNLPEEFEIVELEKVLNNKIDSKKTADLHDEVMDIIESNYELEFDGSTDVSERVIFPSSKSESAGMEDIRLVKFRNDDGTYCYYGTYTAYNGRSYRVQLLETNDFLKFRVRTLHGDQIKDKGMALFPRKINGKYVMTSRLDGENLFIMYSDDLYRWDEQKILYTPRHAFEFIQVGNCGSPIETEYGWLLIIHAVGYFRQYVISALLLDLNDPSRIIGSLDEPLITPVEGEREGYVPNVVYTCGSILNGENLIIPFAISDSSSGFALIKLKDLMSRMKNNS